MTVTAPGPDGWSAAHPRAAPGRPVASSAARDGWLAHTNHFVGRRRRRPRPGEHSGVAPPRSGSTGSARSPPNGTPTDRDALAARLATHDLGPRSVCVHGFPDAPVGQRTATLAVAVTEPADGRLHVHAGLPCQVTGATAGGRRLTPCRGSPAAAASARQRRRGTTASPAARTRFGGAVMSDVIRGSGWVYCPALACQEFSESTRSARLDRCRKIPGNPRTAPPGSRRGRGRASSAGRTGRSSAPLPHGTHAGAGVRLTRRPAPWPMGQPPPTGRRRTSTPPAAGDGAPRRRDDPPNRGLENTMAAFAPGGRARLRLPRDRRPGHPRRGRRAVHDEAAASGSPAAPTRWPTSAGRAAALPLGGREPVPRAGELLAAFPDARLNIDVKSDDAMAPTVAAVAGGRCRGPGLPGVVLRPAAPPHPRRLAGPRVATSCSAWEVAAAAARPAAPAARDRAPPRCQQRAGAPAQPGCRRHQRAVRPARPRARAAGARVDRRRRGLDP